MNTERILKLFSIEGRVAIVTGGAGRLGLKHSEILNDAGARVFSFDVVKNDALIETAEQIVVDITKKQDVFSAFEEVFSRYGRIDILINNAAFNPKIGFNADETVDECWSPHEQYPEELWRKEFDIGLNGASFCTQAAARYMITENRGCILNIASTSAITAPDHRKYKPGQYKSAAYPVVKTALLGLTRSWAAYFASVAPKVRVNAVCFGAVNFGSMEPQFLAKLGGRNMLGRPALPDDYKGTVLFLCSDASAFITASTLVADGGQTAW